MGKRFLSSDSNWSKVIREAIYPGIDLSNYDEVSDVNSMMILVEYDIRCCQKSGKTLGEFALLGEDLWYDLYCAIEEDPNKKARLISRLKYLWKESCEKGSSPEKSYAIYVALRALQSAKCENIAA